MRIINVRGLDTFVVSKVTRNGLSSVLTFLAKLE